jgi:hypothetical protein
MYMKRIKQIEIENSRAYYDRLTFSFENGENLLLYGENGSGKSSLFKSLSDFIHSFRSSVLYVSNRHKPAGATGEIVLSIGDFDESTRQFSQIEEHKFGCGIDNTNIQNTGYLKALALTKGFLSYRDLLKVYLYDEGSPNLFHFFITQLLGNHIPVGQGRNSPLAKEWKSIKKDIFEVHNRQENKHKKGQKDLLSFEKVLRSVLDNLFTQVNYYLQSYFPYFRLAISFDLKPMKFSYGNNKREWAIQQDLRLNIDLDNIHIDNYAEGLNEARLSAIAICLYLAALQATPGKELHFMFLDDIFIGIDSVNRKPILEILNNEFKHFQIVIATYDRSWYHMAKNYLEAHAKGRWKYTNLFSVIKKEDGKSFSVPVMVDGVSSLDRAKEYLHGHRDIDLPASANYFRKALEELLSRLPKELYMNDDYTIVPGFKLTQRVKAVKKFFSKIEECTKNISFLESYLHSLIHPLSHYEEEAQIYRNELVEVEDAISGLKIQIESLSQRCQLLTARGNKLDIEYKTADGSYQASYSVLLDDNIWIYKDLTGNSHITGGECKMKYMTALKNGTQLKPFAPNNKMEIYNQFCYESLDDALQKIYEHEVNINKNTVKAHQDYDIVSQIKKGGAREAIIIRRDELLARMGL